MTTAASSPTPPLATRRRDRALAVAAATVAASIVSLLAPAPVVVMGGQPPMTIGLPMVAGFTLVLSLLGWAALALLERFTARARTAWTSLSVVVLALSLVPPLSATATTGAKLVLCAMHVVAGAALIPLLRRTARR
ncbi:DUF6069 family protein [Nonomuraea soli]|uniref:Phosphatidylserine synthase n=1 Tax=Nonomuraea soli TaxID=1032476 RepID=A0A7W0HUG1_9ACTN|nr:DUF6069 family protein [Nonomuraea soli]MBA2895751.1 phosphatidylserine synthase [Nonomuraea soli]